MAYTKSSLLFITLALTFCSTIHALDITGMLGKNPELAMFNKALTETKLAEEINKLTAVTILAVDNAAMASLSGKSQAAVKLILSNNVLPSFYTKKMLYQAVGPHKEIETMFESSGHSVGRMGYIHVQLVGEGSMAFGSGADAPHATYDVHLVGYPMEPTATVAIYQISKPIVAPGIEAIAGSIAVAGSPEAQTMTFSASVSAGAGNADQSASASSSSSVFFGALSALASLVVFA